MGKWWGKFYALKNLWRQPATRSQVTSDKLIPYFADDGRGGNWPLEWHEAISNSPSGASCVSTITDFLEGEGFSDPDLEKLQVNPRGETFWHIHQKTCKEFAEFEGFFWHFRYNALGQITEWYVLPFENCRLAEPDDSGYISKIYYNPFFGTDLYSTNKKLTVCYHVFNPAVVRQQLEKDKSKFMGQVFFYGTTNAQSRYYPMSEAYSCLEWMKTEAKISEFHANNLKGGLLQSFMFAMIGDPDEPVNNPEDSDNDKPITKGEAFDNMMQSVMGSRKPGDILVNWFDNEGEIPKVIPLPSNPNADVFNTIDNQATKKITIAWKVPAILANISEGATLGGDGNQVRVAVKLMQQRSVRKQRTLTDCYAQALRNMARPYVQDIKITPYNPYPELEVLDQKIWDVMSPEEKRQWVNENTEVKLEETVQQVQLPQPTQARVLNAVPVMFPDNVKAVVKKAVEYQDKMGLKCGGSSGRQLSMDILENKNMGLKQLKRIYSYLKKNEQYKDSPFNEGCNVISYNAWGGKEMFGFLEGELKRLDAWLN